MSSLKRGIPTTQVFFRFDTTATALLPAKTRLVVDIDGGLTPDEHAELEDLELELRRHVNAVAPRPIESLLEEVRALSARFGLASGASM